MQVLPTARIDRAHSDRARSASKGSTCTRSAWIEIGGRGKAAYKGGLSVCLKPRWLTFHAKPAD